MLSTGYLSKIKTGNSNINDHFNDVEENSFSEKTKKEDMFEWENPFA
jgi:hypothetical protein